MHPGPSAASGTRRPRYRHLVLALWLAAGPALAQTHPPAAHGGLDLAETVAGVLAYSRWPETPDPLRICLAGSSPHADRLLRDGLRQAQRPVVLRALAPDTTINGRCDAVYIGQLTLQDWQRLQPELTGKPVLTLCERSEPCTARGMVRLDIEATGQRVRFEVNLDAVARSAVRIHPQVLRLGRRDAAAEGGP